jgi:hypothetical protein
MAWTDVKGNRLTEEDIRRTDRIEKYNVKARRFDYREITVEDYNRMISEGTAVVCEFCDQLVLSGKHSSVKYVLSRHLTENKKCLRIQKLLEEEDSLTDEEVKEILREQLAESDSE